MIVDKPFTTRKKIGSLLVVLVAFACGDDYNPLELVDTTAPEITIVGDNPLTLAQNTEYTELGATALDDTDGDISDRIEITSTGINFDVPGTYQVTYNVSDAAGNATSSAREVIILEPEELDTTVPVITIIGDNPLTIKQYSQYTELGATALDDTDGDISNGIVITSPGVNFLVPGSYEVTYSVSDAAGNSTSVTREVLVEEDTLLNGLVGKFDLDGNGNDTSGFNNHGTMIPNVTAVTNRHNMDNSAMSFENDGGYIDVGDVDALKLTSSISISVWVKASGNQMDWDAIVNKWGDAGYYLGLNPTGNVLRWNIGEDRIVETALPTNEWVHIVATYDGTRSELYINGVLENEIVASGPINDNSNEFSIGRRANNDQFSGEIDDVYVYDRAISASEVLELFNK